MNLVRPALLPEIHVPGYPQPCDLDVYPVVLAAGPSNTLQRNVRRIPLHGMRTGRPGQDEPGRPRCSGCGDAP